MVDLLRVPHTFRTVADALATAQKLDLNNVVIMSEREDGSLVMLKTEMGASHANWLLDRTKMLLLLPTAFERLKP